MMSRAAEPSDPRDPDQASRRVRHDRERSDMERKSDGGLLFRARCSCGWVSEPVDIARTFLVWDEHWQNRKG